MFSLPLAMHGQLLDFAGPECDALPRPNVGPKQLAGGLLVYPGNE